MMIIFLGALAVALVVSLITCVLALKLFPWFRSGERKEGHFRPDQSTGSYRVDTRKGAVRVRATGSSGELPLVGGPAMIVGVVVAGVFAGVALNLDMTQWALMGILLVAMIGFGAVGFIDDLRKVYKGEGISEIQKGIGIFIVSLAAAIALNRLVVSNRLSARLAYPPYSDIPLLGQLLQHTHFAWIVFFLLLTVVVTSSTALAVDFSDGLDGLCGGLLLSASLSFAAILLGEGGNDLWVPAIAVLALAGAVLGYLPFNWPSSWKARNMGWGKRRAVLIMGDTGSLAMGGLLALVAIITRNELVLIFIGGVFVLEGVSGLAQARILVRFFRHFLFLERYNSTRGFPHTEFPLPFLATPMHYHYDLLGWDRKRLVYGAWLLGAGLGVLGVASAIGVFSWERYLARFAALIILLFVWECGPWTRSYFIGLARSNSSVKAGQPRQLALFYGFPFKLFGRPLSAQVDITNITEEALSTPAERLTLWQRMSGFDARSCLGFYCYRIGAYDDALRLWGKIPRPNLEKRPEIAEMLTEVRHSIALETDGELTSTPNFDGLEGAAHEQRDFDPNATAAVQMPLHPDDLAASQTSRNTNPAAPQQRRDTNPAESHWHMAAPTSGRLFAPHLEPAGPDELPDEPPSPTQTTAPLWNASAWTAATGGPVFTPRVEPAPAPSPQSEPPAPLAPFALPEEPPVTAIGPLAELPPDPVPELESAPEPEPVSESSGPKQPRPTYP